MLSGSIRGWAWGQGQVSRTERNVLADVKQVTLICYPSRWAKQAIKIAQGSAPTAAVAPILVFPYGGRRKIGSTD